MHGVHVAASLYHNTRLSLMSSLTGNVASSFAANQINNGPI